MTVLLHNANVYTMDPACPRATAIALCGERIAAVGGEELQGLVGSRTRAIDLAGRCVIPGLSDSHIHFAQFAKGLRQVNLAGTISLEEMLARVAERVVSTPPGEWVQGFGWDQELWPGRRFPSAADLDPVAPLHPVALWAKSGHALVANSLALERAGLSAATSDPPGGRIERGPHGQPTGLLFDTAMEALAAAVPQPDAEKLADLLPEAIQQAWRVGLTSIHDVDDLVAFDAYQRLHATGGLGLRVTKYIPAASLDHALALRLRAGLGDDWLRIGGVKLLSDGALGPRTAAMFEAHLGEPDNFGLLLMQPPELEDAVRRAAAGGLPMAIHAIGDRANRVTLDALAAASAGDRRLRHRIEHVQVLHPNDVGRLAAQGIVASMQPLHATQDAGMAERYWGPRCQYAYAWRSLLDAGTVLAFGSDCPVEDLNPFLGIHAAVTRLSPSYGPGPWRPEQRLTVEEAVRAYTWGPPSPWAWRTVWARSAPASWPTCWCWTATSSPSIPTP